MLTVLPFEPGDPRIHTFFDYWKSVPRDRALPSWDAVHAMGSIAPLMGHLALVELHPTPALHIRYAGAALNSHFGFEITGMDFLEMTVPEQRDTRLRRFTFMAGRPCGLLHSGHLPNRDNPDAEYVSLWLPFARRGSGDTVVVGMHCLPGPRIPTEGPSPLIPLALRLAYVDLGFGIPEPADDLEAIQLLTA